MSVTRLLSAIKIPSALQIVCTALVLSAAVGWPAQAAPDDDKPDPEDLKLGEQLLTRDCARCHAVGRAGASPLAGAPAFRDLGKRYPIESLEEALGEGIMSGHPDMPEFNFDADEVGAIIDYLNSIQAR